MKIAVIGTGYVGLVTGTCFAETGNSVICVDNDQKKLEKLKNAQVTIYEPGLEFLFQRNIHNKRLEFTDSHEYAIRQSDIIFLCLPTPEGEDGSADLRYVLGVSEEIGKILGTNKIDGYKIFVNKSTVPVGTSKKILKALQSGNPGNFDVVSNPEFLREGYAVDDFMKPDRIVIGSDSPKALEIMRTLYEPFVRQGNPIFEMDIASAEVTKYASNSYLAMRITFMNELANYCEQVGADVELIRRGMGADDRIGKRFLFPGIGYGGSCFPKDVKALIRSAAVTDSPLNILAAVDKANERQKLVLTDKISRYFGKSLKGKKIAVWGLAFKPNTDDMREAPSIPIIKKLLNDGAEVSVYDPVAMETCKKFFKESVRYAGDNYSALENADALVVVTEWNEFRVVDLQKVKSLLHEAVIFDGRNIYDPEAMKKAGFKYFGIGRKNLNEE
jgi:UDPglucose 6-dehydrogenase